jgi:hypothetical protein
MALNQGLRRRLARPTADFFYWYAGPLNGSNHALPPDRSEALMRSVGLYDTPAKHAAYVEDHRIPTMRSHVLQG